VKRRDLIIMLGGAAAWPLGARAQQPARARTIGVLMPLAANDPEAQRRIATFTDALRKAGWSEGQTIAFDKRYADGKPDRLPALAAELVQAGVDVIVTQAAQAVDAVRKATTTIPIVMAGHGDALGAGVIGSLARPGGNITGHTVVATEQATKRLDLIKKMYPQLARIAVLWNGNASGHRLQMEAMQLAAPTLGIALHSLPNRSAEEIDASLRAANQANDQAIVTMDDPLIQSNRERIVEFATRQRLPVMGEFRPFVEAGALMSYAPNQVDLWRGAAVYVDKILKGARPAELPVQTPTRFELLINLKAARVLGLEVPAQLIATADEVIE
jgi:ABC-type uncharacterized transport system substrate-binding protein